MFIKQSELFWDLGHDFVKEIMEKTEKETVGNGYILFFEGEPATHFYILIKGNVSLKVGQSGQAVFVPSHTGEAFGWSSLAGRERYSATAECLSPTSVVRVSRDDFEKICEKHPGDALVFMKRLAGMLGQRLLRSYSLMGASTGVGDYMVYGTGQVQETAEEE